MKSEKFCITEQTSMLEAMKTIGQTAIASAIVCRDKKVLGILTDGDIRRALIQGAALSSPVEPYYTRNFTSVGPDAMRADVLELMQARLIEQIPVVDEQGKLQGIHTLHTLLGHIEKPNAAVIMAGGRGTRLGKLTEELPKPMLKVAGRPILERIILHLVSYGIRRVYLSVNYLSHIIEDYFEDGSRWGCAIHYLNEEQPLGTGGALSLLPEQPKHDLLVMNGDLLIETDLNSLLMFHAQGEYYATMGVHYYSHEVPFGCIQTENDRMVDIEEKPLITRTINGGVYVLSPDAVQAVPRNEAFPITRLFEEALAGGYPCGAFHLGGDWTDVGLPEQLKKARGHM